MVLAGTSDTIVPYSSNAANITADAEGSILVSINRGSHIGFVASSRYVRFLANPDIVGCYLIRRALKKVPLTAGYELVGNSDDGIRRDFKVELCQTSPLPPAIDPRRQQLITELAVTSFFQSQFLATLDDRSAMLDYLRKDLARELPDASVQ
jgi:hypothetical protein